MVDLKAIPLSSASHTMSTGEPTHGLEMRTYCFQEPGIFSGDRRIVFFVVLTSNAEVVVLNLITIGLCSV
jgi:hypothetical protein